MSRNSERANVSHIAKKRMPKPTYTNGNGSNITIVKSDTETTYITDIELDADGQYISKVNIDEIVVTSTLKSVPERFGLVSIDFIVTIPKKLQNRKWCINLTPVIMQKDTVIRLDPVVLRGKSMDVFQQRQKWRHDKFCKGINTVEEQLMDETQQNQLLVYNDRKSLFYTKRIDYNLSLYDIRSSFFAGDRNEKYELYDARALFFGRSDKSAREQKLYPVSNVQQNHIIEQRKQNVIDRQQTQALTAEQVTQRYGRTEAKSVWSSRINALNDIGNQIITQPIEIQARMDSVISTPHNMSYFYSKDMKTDEHTSRMTLILSGYAEDYRGRHTEFAPSDTLTYTIASMINFIDYAPRYVYKIVEKYATVNDRSWITFPIGKSTIIDTLSNNSAELEKMTKLMYSLLYQYEFHVDSVILTAASSPEGLATRNESLSRDRAYSLRDYLIKKFNPDIDTILNVRWVGEDWSRLASLVKQSPQIANRDQIVDIIKTTQNPDRRDILIRKSYPEDFKTISRDLYPHLRSVSFKYSLRRVGMIQDTVYTTELDSVYMRGVEALAKRNYKEAVRILDPYKDINSAITLMSLGYDKQAFEVMKSTPQTANRDYMLAILCARQGLIKEGLEYFEQACLVEPTFEFRANLDPEIQILIRNRPKKTQ